MICDKCNGRGFKKIINSQGLEEFEICDCHKPVVDKKILNMKLKEGNFPLHFWEHEIDYYKNNASIRKVGNDKVTIVNYIDNIDNFIRLNNHVWIWGQEPNACHTSLAVLLGKSLIHKNAKVSFISFRKLVDLFIDFDNKRAALDNYLHANYIIIDDMFDLNRASVKQYQAINLYGFIEDCINNNIIFIFTSNQALNQVNDVMFQEVKAILQPRTLTIHLKGL